MPRLDAPYPQATVCCLVHWPARGVILLVKKRPHKYEGGRWGCLGGKQEFGETSLEAACRELREEGGPDLNSDTLRHQGVFGVCEDLVRDLGKHYVTVIHGFEVRARTEPKAVNAEPDNHTAVTWFPLAALPPNITAGFRRVAEAVTHRFGPGLAHHRLTDFPWGFAAEDV